MKILFVNPQPFNQKFGDDGNTFIRHGIAQLSACLKERGHNVSLADFRMLGGWRDYLSILNVYRPDFVCVSVMTCDLKIALEAARFTKNFNNKIILVAGGIHASIDPESLANDFDYVVRGEAETSLPLLIESPDRYNKVFYGVTPDLDTLPFEDRELWPDYERRVSISVWGFETPIVDVLKSRGCPYHCKFCCGPGEQNHYTRLVDGERRAYVRSRSVDHLMGELDQLYDRYKFKSIIFHDDQFILNKEWVREFCQRKQTSRFKSARWWAASRADVILKNRDLLMEMRDAGLSVLSIGLESFSSELLSFWNKGTTPEMNYAAAEYVKSLGIKLYSNLIMGAPRENGKWYIKDDIANLRAVRTLKPEICAYSYFTPMPGSQLYDWCNENDLTLSNNTGERSANDR
jgi:radical SAM superfamily enzyme YgiQ (UPF0313 family)